MPVVRETGASLDIGFEKCAAPEMFTGEQGTEWSNKTGNRNKIQTRKQRRKEAEKSTRLENHNDQFRLGECVVKNGEECGPSFTGEGTDSRNLVILSNCEVMEAQLRNEESVPLIQGIENNANDDASDQEKHPGN
ncbi:uncharacterized protein TNCV_4493201 [Trichonephila clavipes]|uniref:Uncharacterized protein n=1 Tax=Trichonephila clavipes TaxID=2585209 RepID=A0A8X6VPU8_TRICX|nr:uncharacterized protein TNCV_4493141 [Trichonephila clavipes]GFY15062.1 uncharacterized protein TNCV_4493151 [Trichonephila clavipes]GFY15063.1 uncharacterized protein TNCV_4493161 [Trichonephila clavipes]GFY15064.1 uncharacterized protein TNCV_4493171 [Trichonephila clavipes]GFY15065.1 uncharacterized protein TNCV_4493181 [Trichonephila clavipes]